jgi:hypothetical protein
MASKIEQLGKDQTFGQRDEQITPAWYASKHPLEDGNILGFVAGVASGVFLFITGLGPLPY